MDRHLKERMVGAVVLVATAIILIPEMLSGPHRTSDVAEPSLPVSTADGAKLKTYTIDLAKTTAQVPAGSSPIVDAVGKEIPPKENSEPVKSESRSESSEPPRVEPPSSEVKQEAPKPQRETKSEHEMKPETPAAKPAPKAPTSSSASTGGSWAVQVGSFGTRATADRLVNDLKRAGFPAFVVSFEAGKQTLYRVRVGPAHDRAGAEKLLQKVKGRYPGAALVPPS